MKKVGIMFLLLLLMLSIQGCSKVDFTTSYLGQGVEEDKELVYEDIVNEIIRFHVLANSDSDEDQQLKLKVRDKVIEYVSSKLESCNDLDEARSFIIENKSIIEGIAKDVIIENGYSYNVVSILSRENFPDKAYGDLIFPQGEYEAYRILIGEANGQNWWCVMFPPLCFVDGTKDVVNSKEIEERLNEAKEGKKVEGEEGLNEAKEEKKIEGEEGLNEAKEEKKIEGKEVLNGAKEEKKVEGEEVLNGTKVEKKVEREEKGNKIKFKFKIFEVLFSDKK